ncbi:MAG: hypothetical protein V8S08_11395 [Lachnoclostridium sp.]
MCGERNVGNDSGRKSIVFGCISIYQKEFYIPKPFGRVEISLKDIRGDSVQKKQYKKMKYIPVNYVDEFLQGKFPEEHLADMDKLGKHDMRVSVAIEGNEEPMPYRVSSFLFHENAGLYIVLAYEREDCHELFRQLIESLSYSGIGGKRSSGMGRFEFLEGWYLKNWKKN